jgi:hypothetical protein
MARSLDTSQQALLDSGSAVRRIFLTVDITDVDGNNPETVGFWDGPETVNLGTQWPDFESLQANPSLTSIQQVSDLSIPNATMTVTGVPDTPVADLVASNSRWHQRPATIWIGLYDPANMKVVGDLLPFFVGYWDKATFVDGPVGEESSLEISLESAARELTRSNPDVRSDLTQRERDSSDEGMQFIGKDAKMEWGIEQKKRKNKNKRNNNKRNNHRDK